jgi:hypothetical protein
MNQPLRKKAEDALLLALACGATVENAARQCGLSERTIYRRLREPAFRQRLGEVRTEMVQRTAALLTAASLGSVKTLLALQKDNHPAGVRLGAARAVLELGVKLRESGELLDRIAALEAHLPGAAGRASGRGRVPTRSKAAPGRGGSA